MSLPTFSTRLRDAVSSETTLNMLLSSPTSLPHTNNVPTCAALTSIFSCLNTKSHLHQHLQLVVVFCSGLLSIIWVGTLIHSSTTSSSHSLILTPSHAPKIHRTFLVDCAVARCVESKCTLSYCHSLIQRTLTCWCV